MSTNHSIEQWQKRLNRLINRLQNILDSEPLDKSKYWQYYHQSESIVRELDKYADSFFDELNKDPSIDNIERIKGKLLGLADDLNQGFLHPEWLIQDNETFSLMKQAEELLLEGADSEYEESKNLPAAAVTGVALERFLRQLCERHEPPIPTTTDGDRFKMLGTIKNELEQKGLFDASEKRKLKKWIEIRNNAVHGYFKKFTREDVENMIDGVKDFIEKHRY